MGHPARAQSARHSQEAKEGCPCPQSQAARLKGQRVQSIHRRAKYIVLTFSKGDTLLIHLRMTGQLSLDRPRAPREPHQHIVLRLDDGRDLRYRDTRKFGRWLLTRTPERILGAPGSGATFGAF